MPEEPEAEEAEFEEDEFEEAEYEEVRIKRMIWQICSVNWKRLMQKKKTMIRDSSMMNLKKTM